MHCAYADKIVELNVFFNFLYNIKSALNYFTVS